MDHSEFFISEEDEFQIYIPNSTVRKDVCEAYIDEKTMCDISKYDMASISSFFDVNDDSTIDSLEGLQYMIGTRSINAENTSISSISSLSNLTQLGYLYLSGNTQGEAHPDISSLESLQNLDRLVEISLFGNETLSDISVLYRNINIQAVYLHDGDYGYYSIPLCRSEDDDTYWKFIQTVFPTHDDDDSNREYYFLPNDCPLNSGKYVYNCDSTDVNCPSIIRNEVYSTLVDPSEKQCAWIAKADYDSNSDLICYTIHDANLRKYIKDTYPGIEEDNGMISVAALRSTLSGSLDLKDVMDQIGDVGTLQGLEYASGLTELNLDGYDLSQSSATFAMDRLVIMILAKAVTYSNYYGAVDSGLTSLSLSGCGLRRLESILDFTPVHTDDFATQSFKLESLDISNNSVSDLSWLITNDMFQADTLTSLNISDNLICDIDNVVAALQDYFVNLTELQYDNQTCLCTEGDVSFTNHLICRELYADMWVSDCWKGYYLDMASNECMLACNKKYELNDDGVCVRNNDILFDNAADCRLCEWGSAMAIKESGDDHLTCICAEGYVGDDCTLACPSNAGASCNNHGTCIFSQVDDTAICECEDGYYGDSCSSLCPVIDGLECSGNGSCQTIAQATGFLAECICSAHWFGSDCSSPCPVDSNGIVCHGDAYGVCDSDLNECVCTQEEQVGSACEFTCTEKKSKDYFSCDGHGECVISHAYDPFGIQSDSGVSCSCSVWFSDKSKEGSNLHCFHLSVLSICLIVFSVLVCVAGITVLIVCCVKKVKEESLQASVEKSSTEKAGLLADDEYSYSYSYSESSPEHTKGKKESKEKKGASKP
ncbi:hypothetical protein ADUPG1_011100 [Aduncisulcus paluster]|uniref:EGF-like domain-containing protein n=1 Tax=Aduncisulcus paluster TaxID=2918883 RepID=A0ABQ5JU99_9EUKA|nr:hypothetical protein ADUPG1_011100 [Aduncisulcus paluster]